VLKGFDIVKIAVGNGENVFSPQNEGEMDGNRRSRKMRESRISGKNEPKHEKKRYAVFLLGDACLVWTENTMRYFSANNYKLDRNSKIGECCEVFLL